MAETDTKPSAPKPATSEPATSEPAALAPAALVGEIERTRANLAKTIDEIADRVSPANVARRTASQVRKRLSQVDPLVGGAAALAVVSVAGYLVWRRLRRLPLRQFRPLRLVTPQRCS